MDGFWDWLLTGLIYLDPTVATAYYQAVAQDDTSQSNGRRRAPVSWSDSTAGSRQAVTGVVR